MDARIYAKMKSEFGLDYEFPGPDATDEEMVRVVGRGLFGRDISDEDEWRYASEYYKKWIVENSN